MNCTAVLERTVGGCFQIVDISDDRSPLVRITFHNELDELDPEQNLEFLRGFLNTLVEGRDKIHRYEGFVCPTQQT